jgi:hypothetical protein
MIKDAARGMKEWFGLLLALIIIDTLMPAAQFKDADKSTEARQIMDMLAALGHEFEALVVRIVHFGKDVSTGTRNASTKEDAADTVLALLGERSLAGIVSDPRTAIRKGKGAERGIEFPFTRHEIVVDETKTGKPIKTPSIRTAPGTEKPPKAWPKSLHISKRALDKKLGDSGKRLRPFLDGPEVLAVPSAAVLAEFLKAYLTKTKRRNPKLSSGQLYGL